MEREGNRHERSDQLDVGNSYLWTEKEENLNGFQIGLKIAQFQTLFSGLPLGLEGDVTHKGRTLSPPLQHPFTSVPVMQLDLPIC